MNFCDLCAGDKGHHALTRKPLSYKASTFHRVVEGTLVQGGDFLFGDGTGSESVYGGKFADEGFQHTHDREVTSRASPTGATPSHARYVRMPFRPTVSSDDAFG